MIDDLPKPQLDLRHLDPDVRKERVKLVSNAFNALGLALVIGSTAAPIVDPGRTPILWRLATGLAVGGVLILAAYWVLRYVKPKET